MGNFGSGLLRVFVLLVFVVAIVVVTFSGWPIHQGGKKTEAESKKKAVTPLPIYPREDRVKVSVCHEDPEPEGCPLEDDPPTIYLVTPTYTRREQIAELTRLVQTLIQVPNLYWVVAEDSISCHKHVLRLSKRVGIPRTHIASPIPDMYKKHRLEKTPRGVSSRRAGLQWVLKRHGSFKERCDDARAVIYFADDDNTYDLRIFEQIRTTKKVSVFPVGLIGLQSFSSPMVVDGRVVGFADPWYENRKFPVDMAGFATSVDFILDSKRSGDKVAEMPYKVGFEEDLFLKSLNVELKDLEPLGSNCTEILVWHTQTVKEKTPNLKRHTKVHSSGSNLEALIQSMSDTAIVNLNDRSGFKIDACTNPKGCDTSHLKRY